MKIGSTDISNCKIGSTQINSVYIGTVKVWDYYCAELQAIIARANALGYTLPAAATLTAMNTLILAMKSGGFWAEQDLILNFAYNNTGLSDFCKINWKTPADTLATLNGGLTYQASGFLGNASDGYIDTNWNPATYGGNYTLNNAGRGFVQYTTGSTGYADGTTGSQTNQTWIETSQIYTRINSGTTNLNVATDLRGIGYKGINRDDSTNLRLYNKSTEYTRTQNSSSITNANQVLFRRQAGYSNVGLSMYHCGASVSQIIKEQFRTSYNAYLVSIGLTAFA